MICLCSSSPIGRSSVSCCKAAVDVVLKHPVIVFMASCCTDVRLLSCDEIGEFLLSTGLGHIAAPYWIPGLITAVYNLLTYLNGVPHVILAILDNAGVNLVPLLVM